MSNFPLLSTLQVTGDHLSGPYSENLYCRWVMGKWVDIQTSFSSQVTGQGGRVGVTELISPTGTETAADSGR